MSVLLSLLKSRAAPYVLAGVLVAGWFASYTHQQREIGRQQVLLATARQATATATQRAESLASAYRVDTVRLNRLQREWDTTYINLLDTVTVHRTDTVRVPVTVLVAADSTIRACRAVVQTCEQRVAAEHQIALGWQHQVEQLRAGQPSTLRVWVTRLGWLGVGLVVGRAVIH